jgi:hypothetical protein
MLAALGGGSFAAHAHQVAFQNELSGCVTLVLATEPALLAKKDVQVRLACTGPL